MGTAIYQFNSEDELFSGIQSGDPAIDSLVYEENGIANWNWLVSNESPRPIYYTFALDEYDPAWEQYESETRKIAFDPQQQQFTRQAITYIDEITGLTHLETNNSSAADLHFAYADLLDAATTGLTMTDSSYTLFGGTGRVGSIDLDHYLYLDTSPANNVTDLSPGGYGYETLLHELGHTLGLAHPHEDLILDPNLDLTANTLMSYNASGGPYTTFREIDLAAINWLYGGDGMGGVGYGLSGDGPSIAENSGSSVEGSTEVSDVGLDDRVTIYTDFSQGAAGYSAVMLIGAAFGAGSIPQYFSAGLHFLSSGMSLNAVAELIVENQLIESLTGPDTDAWVSHVYQNVVGEAPDAFTQQVLSSQLESGALSKTDLLVLAAQSPLTESQVDLLGLQSTGIEYLPYSA